MLGSNDFLLFYRREWVLIEISVGVILLSRMATAPSPCDKNMCCKVTTKLSNNNKIKSNHCHPV